MRSGKDDAGVICLKWESIGKISIWNIKTSTTWLLGTHCVSTCVYNLPSLQKPGRLMFPAFHPRGNECWEKESNVFKSRNGEKVIAMRFRLELITQYFPLATPPLPPHRPLIYWLFTMCRTFKVFIYLLCMCLFVFMGITFIQVSKRQEKRELGALNLEFQMIVSHHLWVFWWAS